MGSVHFGQVTGASIGYTLKYICKRCVIGLADWDDRVPAFQLMSKGMGKAYLTDSMIRWHRSDMDNRLYCTIDGKKITLPRYYKERIYAPEELDLIRVAQQVRIDDEKEAMLKRYNGDHDAMEFGEAQRYFDAIRKLKVNNSKIDKL